VAPAAGQRAGCPSGTWGERFCASIYPGSGHVRENATQRINNESEAGQLDSLAGDRLAQIVYAFNATFVVGRQPVFCGWEKMMNETDPSTTTNTPETFRSPQLMNAHDSALVVIDVQEKLIPHIQNHEKVTWNISRLITGAELLGIQIVATEQYPQGLGATVNSIRQPLSASGTASISEKTMFSCRECAETFSHLYQQGIYKLLLTGIETHVCVAQSALDFIAAGFSVYVCVDAVGSRYPVDHETALRRLENSGAIPTTTESALFEWCEQADRDEFKTISKLIQEEL
jgi:nicotinamidase-related amidase